MVLLYCIQTEVVFQVLLYCISHLKSSISCGSTPEEFLEFVFFFSLKSCMNSLLPLGVVVQQVDNIIVI